MQTDPQVPLSKISGFLRKLTHDLRNHLNSSSLEITYLADCVEDPEMVDSLNKVQTELQLIEKQLKAISRKLAVPHPTKDQTEARLLPILWQEAQDTLNPAPTVHYSEEVPDAIVHVDVDDFIAIATEILKNTVQHGSRSGSFSMHLEENTQQLLVRYTEISVLDAHPHSWGESPFISNQMKSHGLGLFMASRLVQANGGSLQFQFNETRSELSTELRFPLLQSA